MPKCVGEENFFLFGLNEEQVSERKKQGYNPIDLYNSSLSIREVIDRINGGAFSPENPELFKPLTDSLLYHDEYMLLADFEDYANCHQRVVETYLNKEKWLKMSMLNVARIGKFSSDRTIKEYCEDIWNTKPIEINLNLERIDIEALKLKLSEKN